MRSSASWSKICVTAFSSSYTGPSEVVIALGTNQGNRVDNLLSGLTALRQNGIEVLRVSLLYETLAMYITEQPAYLNAAVLARTDSAEGDMLLLVLVLIPGRDIISGLRYAPRPLDLDIIFFGSQDVQHEALSIPHISWHERGFVKAPIADLLQPDDIQRGYIQERDPSASVLDKLLQAVQQWEAEGGETQPFEEALIMLLLLPGVCMPVMLVLVPFPVDGVVRLSAEGELARVLPVIRALRDDSEMVHVPLSIDTYHARVAEEAVAAGADMINDVSGGLHDSHMFTTAARLGVPYVLMHMRGELNTMTQPANTKYDCVWREVGQALKQRAQLAVAAGILPWNLVLDPGLGFSKTAEGSAELLGNLQVMRREQLRGLWGRMPLLVGPSRKGFIGRITGRHNPAERDLGTAAACVAAVAQGADIVRVHNVPMIAEALFVADAVIRGTWPLHAD
eukprot:gene12958-13087_t